MKESWILDPVPRMQYFRVRIQDPGSWMPDQDPGSWIGSWILDAQSRIQDSGPWILILILDRKPWILDPRYWTQNPDPSKPPKPIGRRKLGKPP